EYRARAGAEGSVGGEVAKRGDAQPVRVGVQVRIGDESVDGHEQHVSNGTGRLGGGRRIRGAVSCRLHARGRDPREPPREPTSATLNPHASGYGKTFRLRAPDARMVRMRRLAITSMFIACAAAPPTLQQEVDRCAELPAGAERIEWREWVR